MTSRRQLRAAIATTGPFLPVLDWLEANGVDRDTVAFQPVGLVDDGATVVYFTTWFDRDGRPAEHGGEPMWRQCTAAVTVPPPPGLIESANQAFRRAEVREALRVMGLQALVITEQPHQAHCPRSVPRCCCQP